MLAPRGYPGGRPVASAKMGSWPRNGVPLMRGGGNGEMSAPSVAPAARVHQPARALELALHPARDHAPETVSAICVPGRADGGAGSADAQQHLELHQRAARPRAHHDVLDYPDDAGGHARSRPPCHFVEQSIQASAQLAEIGASLPGRRSGRGNYVTGSWPRPVAAPPVVGQAAH